MSSLSKKFLKFLMVFVMIVSVVHLPICASEVTTTIPYTKTSGDSNYFTLAPNAWEVGNQTHTWSKAPSASLKAEDIWYEVKFIGHKIDIYAGKNHPMGKVEYFIDGESKGVFSLYRSSNVDEELITTFNNLSEGEHTFKAVSKGEKDTNSTNTLIDCAKVVVYHEPYKANAIEVNQTNINIKAGSTSQLNCTIKPDYCDISSLKFTSSDDKIAVVDSNGLIRGLKEGEATITISNIDNTISKQVKVIVQGSLAQASASIIDNDTAYPQSRYDEVKTYATLSKDMMAWKNETVYSRFLVVSQASKLTNVTIETNDLTNGNKIITKDNIKASFIKSTLAYNGAYLGYGDKNRPVPSISDNNRSEANDIISNDKTCQIDLGEFQNVLLEIAIPKNAESGQYTTTINIKANELATPISLTYNINVIDATLSEVTDWKDSFDIELWQYPYTSAEYYNVEPFSDDHMKILRSLLEVYKGIGGHVITTSMVDDAWNAQTYSANDVHYPSMVKWTKNSDGSFSYDYSHFDKWVTLCKEMGIGDKIIIYSIAPWTNCFSYWENNTLKYEQYQVGSERYNTVFTNFLINLTKHLDEKGWFDDAYIGFDERGFDSRAFDLIESIKNKDGHQLKIQGSMDSFVNKHDLAMRVTDLNVGDTAADKNPTEFSALVKERAELGLRTATYSCTEHRPGNFALSAPCENYASIINAGKETDGFMRWAYDAWVKDPLTDTTHNAFEAGDCFLVYPSDTDDANILRSYRLIKMMEGLQDVNKLRLIANEVTDLQSDINDLYNEFDVTFITTRNLYSKDEIVNLAGKINDFKTGLENLSIKYLEKKVSGTNTINAINVTGKTSGTIGERIALQTNFEPSNVLNKAVTYTSSDESIAKVSKDGIVTLLKNGEVTITVTSKQDSSKNAIIKITVGSVNVENSLVNYYPFDGNVADNQGNRNGKVNGNVTYVEGKQGQGIKVTETNNVTFEESSSVGNAKNWTISYWVYPTKTINDRFSVMMDANKDYSFDLKMASDRNAGFHVGKNSGDVLTFAYTYNQNSWYHITWVLDQNNGLTQYVNGTKLQTNKWTLTNDIKAPLDIIGGTGFEGYIDELKVFNRALNDNEVATLKEIKGINLISDAIELKVNETYQINPSLEGYDVTNPSYTYVSSDEMVVKVSSKGVITALNSGNAIITITNKETNIKTTLKVKVLLPIKNNLTKYDLAEKYLSDVEGASSKEEGTLVGTDRQYLGQPDMVQTDSGRLITVFPMGHGHGPLIMKISEDQGETWVEKTDIPSSWKDSQETPTIYRVTHNGNERLVLICACPGSWGNYTTGWDMSYSDDGGDTWTEFEHYHSTINGTKNDVIVAMASLIQLKDENGNYIEKWMGVYHNAQFVNMKTYLTFAEDGTPQWSTPEPYLSEYRDIESSHQICEVGMFRSPDGKRIVALARNQTHQGLATMFYSDDEGNTWCEPSELPGSLAGERHKAMYDPISGRLVITFREIIYDLDGNGQFGNDWLAGDWVAWVGTYDDLMAKRDGDYMIVLDYDWAANAKSGDTGYTGMALLADGTFVLHSYGHWDKEYSESFGNSYNVKTDLSWIRQAKFKLGQIENDFGLINYDILEKTIEQTKVLDLNAYESSSVKILNEALSSANSIITTKDKQQVEVDAAVKELTEAIANLKPIEVKPKPEYKGYDDVNEKEWYAGMIKEATLAGLMGKDGSTGNNFNPDGKITRGMVATILYRMEGKPQVTYAAKFSDVKDGQWYSAAITWASNFGVVSGYKDGRFGPDDNIKREDLAIMIRNYANKKGLNTKVNKSLDSFNDYKKVSSYAKDAIAWCVENGIMSGSTQKDGIYLQPSANASRAEGAKMFVLLNNLISK